MKKYTLELDGTYTDNDTNTRFIQPGSSSWGRVESWIAEGNTPLDPQPSEYHDLIGDNWILNLERARDAMWEKIKKERDLRKSGGFKVSGKWYHSDQDSRIQQLGLLIAGAAIPLIPWKTMDGTFETLTPALVSQIFQAGFALDTALFAQAEQHRTLMMNSSDPLNYNYKIGWSENFLGL